MSEIRSKPANKPFRDHYDEIFRKDGITHIDPIDPPLHNLWKMSETERRFIKTDIPDWAKEELVHEGFYNDDGCFVKKPQVDWEYSKNVMVIKTVDGDIVLGDS